MSFENDNYYNNYENIIKGPFYDDIENSRNKNFQIMMAFFTLVLTIILIIFFNEIYCKYKEIKEINNIKNIKELK
jgi:hypothetical protein